MEPLLVALGAHLHDALVACVAVLLLLVGPLAVIVALAGIVSSLVTRAAIALAGPTVYLALFGWLGTAIHELGHAAVCLLTRQPILELRLFAPDAETGTLGYVRYGRRGRIWGLVARLPIGLGPVLLGGTLIAVAAWLLVDDLPLVAPPPPIEVAAGPWSRLAALGSGTLALAGRLVAAFADPARLADWRTWLFAWICLAVGSGIGPSLSDLAGAAVGLAVFALLVFVACLVAGLFAPDGAVELALLVARHLAPMNALLLGAVLFTAAVGLLALGPVWLVRRAVARG